MQTLNVLKSIKEGKEGFTRAAYSAYRERSLGLGAMGFHAYLQQNKFLLKVSSLRASTIKFFNTLKYEPLKFRTAEERGEAPDIGGSGMRNAHLLAVAPNASSSIICGGTSPSIEPYRANVYNKTLSEATK